MSNNSISNWIKQFVQYCNSDRGDIMLALLLISFNIFTIVLTAKSELYQIEWFHSDTVNIQSTLGEAW